MSYRGHTKIERKEVEQKNSNWIKSSFGKDFAAKLKSERRYGVRDFRKEMGPGSASTRRFVKSRALKNKMK